MKHITLIALSIIVALASCKKEKNEPKDIQRPAIQLLSPAGGAEIVSGNNITVQATITDNKDLSQYKIEIHDDFDGHTHLKTGSPTFLYDTIVDIGGTNALVNITINVPADVAAGPYHFIMNALDRAGNEAEFAEAEFTIKSSLDSVAPMLNVVATPAPSGGIIHLHGAQKTISLACNASDNESLKTYEIKLINVTSHTVYADKDGSISGTNATFNETITFDDAWPDGDYILEIRVFDLTNNAADIDFDVMRMK